MQKTTANISDRLRGILSDLSSFIGKDTCSAALPACESHNRDLFIKRVHSFQSSSWFAKPCWLSPIICARYGWINIDVDLLQCVGCQSVLVVRTPSSFDPAIYDACQKRLEDQLKRDAHHLCCTWPSCPTPEVIILAHNGSSRAVVMEDFINKAVLLYSIGKDLPVVEHVSLNVLESDFAALYGVVTNSPKFPHDTEIPGALQSAVLLALTGWDLSSSSRAFPGCTSLQCSLCMRQPGLWNYISITDGTDREAGVETYSCGEFLLDHEINTEKESEESQAVADHSSCAMIDSQLSPYEIVDAQTEAGGTSFPVVIEGSLPLKGNCMDWQESLMSSQEVEAIDESQNGLPSTSHKDDERYLLAVSSDRDDNTELVTSDMIGVADIDEHTDHSGATANAHKSLSGFLPSENKNNASSAVGEPEHCIELTENLDGNENMAYDGMQMTDSRLPCDVVQQEPSTLDTGKTEELRIEWSKNDSDRLGVCPEFDSASNHEDTMFDAAGSDAKEIINDSTDILTARDECQPHKDIDECSRDEFVSLDNVEEDVDSIGSQEDLSRVSLEPQCSAVDDSETAKMKYLEEATPETESMVQCAEDSESVESDPQEALQKSTDADTEAAVLDLTVRDGLQRDERPPGLDGKSKHIVDDAGIIEDIRHLLADLIDDVVQDAGDQNDCTKKPSKRCATDILVSWPEPKHKRLFSTVAQRTVFNPVTEHHLWCPYICDIVYDGFNDAAHDVACKPWLRLLHQLVPDAEAALSRVPTSSVPEGIDRIRKLFRTWTSSA